MRRTLLMLGLIALAGCSQFMPTVTQPPPYPQIRPLGRLRRFQLTQSLLPKASLRLLPSRIESRR